MPKALLLLKPHLQHLPFNHLKDLRETTEWVGSCTFQFTIQPEHLTVPIGVGLNNLVRTVFTRLVEDQKNRKINMRRLLLEKKPALFPDARWLLWESHFMQEKTDADDRPPSSFVSTSSSVVVVTDDTLPRGMKSEDSFHTECWEALRYWAQCSVVQKAETYRQLIELVRACGRPREAV
ncbi:MAG: hypothetical protein EXS46_00940 [Candidatus Taylorbacteria bacterium]|nr:hypothetical protein [Candidatus Taylorbacteria bacterium]